MTTQQVEVSGRAFLSSEFVEKQIHLLHRRHTSCFVRFVEQVFSVLAVVGLICLLLAGFLVEGIWLMSWWHHRLDWWDFVFYLMLVGVLVLFLGCKMGNGSIFKLDFLESPPIPWQQSVHCGFYATKVKEMEAIYPEAEFSVQEISYGGKLCASILFIPGKGDLAINIVA